MPGGGLVAIDRISRVALVQPTSAIGALEIELRAAGWTLGPLPEGADRIPVVSALALDAPALAGSGAGFAARRYDESSSGVRLRIEPLPEVQAGTAVLLPDLAGGFAALRRLAQDGLLVDEAILLDRAAADLWLAAAEVDERTSSLLRPDDALLVLVAQGASGAASERVATAAAELADLGGETLGQDVAQAWAAARERPSAAVAPLAAAGWALERREGRRPWSEAAAAAPEAGRWIGLEATGADAQSVLLRTRLLSAAG
jgi:hypothetical protein